MTIYDVIKELVDDKKEQIVQEINIIDEGIEDLRLEQESLMSSDIMSDDIIQKTWECHKNQMALKCIKNKFEYINSNISDTDEVSDIYSHYGLTRNDWLENYKKGKA